WRLLPGIVRHSFTYFHLELQVLIGQARASPGAGLWVAPRAFGAHGLPDVTRPRSTSVPSWKRKALRLLQPRAVPHAENDDRFALYAVADDIGPDHDQLAPTAPERSAALREVAQ